MTGWRQELVMDTAVYVLTLGHYLQIWLVHGLKFKRRFKAYASYRAATHCLQHAFPDAVVQHLESSGAEAAVGGPMSHDCTICMEAMTVAKQLPCGHCFHLACLRAWLQQSGSDNFSCPLCRQPLLEHERRQRRHEAELRTMELLRQPGLMGWLRRLRQRVRMCILALAVGVVAAAMQGSEVVVHRGRGVPGTGVTGRRTTREAGGRHRSSRRRQFQVLNEIHAPGEEVVGESADPPAGTSAAELHPSSRNGDAEDWADDWGDEEEIAQLELEDLVERAATGAAAAVEIDAGSASPDEAADAGSDGQGDDTHGDLPGPSNLNGARVEGMETFLGGAAVHLARSIHTSFGIGGIGYGSVAGQEQEGEEVMSARQPRTTGGGEGGRRCGPARVDRLASGQQAQLLEAAQRQTLDALRRLQGPTSEAGPATVPAGSGPAGALDAAQSDGRAAAVGSAAADVAEGSEDAEESGPPISDAPPPIGSIHQGTVHTIKPFGLFLSVDGYRRQVLVHHSQVDEGVRFEREDDDETKVKALDFLFPKGASVYVKVTEVNEDGNRPGEMRVSGSMRVVAQEDGKDLDPTGSMANSRKACAFASLQRLVRLHLCIGFIPTAPRRHPAPAAARAAASGPAAGTAAPAQRTPSRSPTQRHSRTSAAEAAPSAAPAHPQPDAAQSSPRSTPPQPQAHPQPQPAPDETQHPDTPQKPSDISHSPSRAETSGEDLDPSGLRYKPRGEGGGPGFGGQAALGSNAGEVRGGKIDWGHLAGDRKQNVGDHSGKYDIIDDNSPHRRNAPSSQGGMALPPPPPFPAPAPASSTSAFKELSQSHGSYRILFLGGNGL
eukprot:gene20709-27518_t